jgi:hypothetical protein
MNLIAAENLAVALIYDANSNVVGARKIRRFERKAHCAAKPIKGLGFSPRFGIYNQFDLEPPSITPTSLESHWMHSQSRF